MTPEEAAPLRNALGVEPRAARRSMCSFGLGELHDRDTPWADRSTTLALGKAFGTRRDALDALNSLYSS